MRSQFADWIFRIQFVSRANRSCEGSGGDDDDDDEAAAAPQGLKARPIAGAVTKRKQKARQPASEGRALVGIITEETNQPAGRAESAPPSRPACSSRRSWEEMMKRSSWMGRPAARLLGIKTNGKMMTFHVT
jgi:hypothetical protein